MEEIDSERAFYQRQAARGKMTEIEFDARMGETDDARQYWESELTDYESYETIKTRCKMGWITSTSY